MSNSFSKNDFILKKKLSHPTCHKYRETIDFVLYKTVYQLDTKVNTFYNI